jgi:hypothetical protein
MDKGDSGFLLHYITNHPILSVEMCPMQFLQINYLHVPALDTLGR